MNHGLGVRDRLHDHVALDEIELYAEVLIAVADVDRRLSLVEIDRVLGLGTGSAPGETGETVHVSARAPKPRPRPQAPAPRDPDPDTPRGSGPDHPDRPPTMRGPFPQDAPPPRPPAPRSEEPPPPSGSSPRVPLDRLPAPAAPGLPRVIPGPATGLRGPLLLHVLTRGL
ncbi:hypothetical protein ABZ617_24600 [Nocardiopsis alba]|uniref:hypothetical protein n=1 Tax=Nocardiopsis alba TaxID=53437 RepID=UPI0033F520A3